MRGSGCPRLCWESAAPPGRAEADPPPPDDALGPSAMMAQLINVDARDAPQAMAPSTTDRLRPCRLWPDGASGPWGWRNRARRWSCPARTAAVLGAQGGAQPSLGNAAGIRGARWLVAARHGPAPARSAGCRAWRPPSDASRVPERSNDRRVGFGAQAGSRVRRPVSRSSTVTRLRRDGLGIEAAFPARRRAPPATVRASPRTDGRGAVGPATRTACPRSGGGASPHAFAPRPPFLSASGSRRQPGGSAGHGK